MRTIEEIDDLIKTLWSRQFIMETCVVAKALKTIGVPYNPGDSRLIWPLAMPNNKASMDFRDLILSILTEYKELLLQRDGA